MSVRLNLLFLSCGQVNDLLSGVAVELAALISTHLVEDNRQKNKELVSNASDVHCSLTLPLQLVSALQRHCHQSV